MSIQRWNGIGHALLPGEQRVEVVGGRRVWAEGWSVAGQGGPADHLKGFRPQR